MAIICKLRAYEVKETTSCPSILQNLTILLSVAIVAAGAVLGICFMAEPTAKAAVMKRSLAPAQVVHQTPVLSSAAN